MLFGFFCFSYNLNCPTNFSSSFAIRLVSVKRLATSSIEAEVCTLAAEISFVRSSISRKDSVKCLISVRTCFESSASDVVNSEIVLISTSFIKIVPIAYRLHR